MGSNLDFSLAASFVDKVSAPMGAVANQTDSTMAKFVDYDAALRTSTARGALTQNKAEQLALAAAGVTLAQKNTALNASVSAQ